MKKGDVVLCKIPGEILYSPALKLAEKVFLGLVFTFRKNGLRLSNQEIGKIVGLAADNVSRMISRLADSGWIKITGKQSRWRAIYFDAGVRVGGENILNFHPSTLTLASIYSDAGVKHKVKIKKNGKTDSSFPCEPSTPEIKPTRETPPDPERVERVLKDLGFISEAV